MRRVFLYLLITASCGTTAFAQAPASAGRSNVPATQGRGAGIGGASIAEQRRATPQTGTGRLAETRGAAQFGSRTRRDRPLFERRSQISLERRNERASASSEARTEPGAVGMTNRADAARIAPAQSQRPLRPEHVLQNRLAAIDRMRDQALATENLNLLQRADELERAARAEHAQVLGGVLSSAPLDSTAVAPTTPDAPTSPDSPTSPTGDVGSAPTPPAGPYVPPGLHGREFGQHISEQARLYGREFGKYVSEQARDGGAPFGRGIDRRNYEPPPVVNEPAPVAPPTVVAPQPDVTGPTPVEPPTVSEPQLLPPTNATVEP